MRPASLVAFKRLLIRSFSFRGRLTSGLNILLVDDNEGWLSTVSALLTTAGHRVTACSSVEEALASFRLEPPDLIITDYEMWPQPGGDGDRLIRAVRAIELDGPHRTPIHLLSGAFEAQRRWAEFGADGFTDKNPILYGGQALETLLEIPTTYTIA
jgi:CheY-like chemotaxis protein